MARRRVVAITGAAGSIGYYISAHIARGELYGDGVPVHVVLMDLEPHTPRLVAIRMELEDCASPLLARVDVTTDPRAAFCEADAVFLVGAAPRRAGMERRDLLARNAAIFREHGQAMRDVGSFEAKLLVVGNPVNTNAYVLARYAPNIQRDNVTGLLRLDYNRALQYVSSGHNVSPRLVDRLAVWGNHSTTVFPDLRNLTVGGRPVQPGSVCGTGLVSHVRARGAEVIGLRGSSSALSAAVAAVEHMRDWINGTEREWTSMAVPSTGWYGVPDGIVFGVPVRCIGMGSYDVVTGIEFDGAAHDMLHATIAELVSERNEASGILCA
ncbi:putative malate dehydrogenase [Candidatus Tremblaya princeps PCIT]|uniref:malate dehydrogenase n=1 Tax=Tremblaya princeps (strain PCIT) TaxID=891398 RepID=F7XYM5_TREPP|nr:putative malate dehydrogenase [Candidatus Tremblaya princeps PCIT]AEK38479.1 malate dehydrogenase [Candidatus Tremblaya princeps PCVAL]